jgi:hypothetical protein
LSPEGFLSKLVSVEVLVCCGAVRICNCLRLYARFHLGTRLKILWQLELFLAGGLSPVSTWSPGLQEDYNESGCLCAAPLNWLIWNCRGIGNVATVHELLDLSRTHSSQLIFLCETRQKCERVQRLRNRLGLRGFSELTVME